MWTPLQPITSAATALQPSRTGLAAIISCTLALVVAPELSGAQCQ
jgi:hypothetical protein